MGDRVRARGRRTGVLLAIVLLATAGSAGAHPLALVGRAAAAVEPRFDPARPERGPLPSDRLTLADAAQRTGLRVALPLPDCALQPSTCDDVHLLNELDGFDLSPRLAVAFSGPIDPASVTVRSLFLVRLAPGPPEAMAVDRLVYDPGSQTLYARPETLLEPETRYGLVVTRELRDVQGRPLRPSAAFRGFLRRRAGPPAVQDYRRRLNALMAALDRRGVREETVTVAAVFTTASVTTFLEHARDALERRPPPPAVMTAPEGGGRAYFPRATLKGLVLRRQVRVALEAPDAFQDGPLSLAALPPDAVAGVGVGWYWSPAYLTRDRRIVEAATARPQPAAPGDVPLPFVIVLPAGSRPPEGWPVAIMGHGYGGEMFSSALRIAGVLARHGIATAAVTVVGHGGGPEGRLIVERTDGAPLEVRVPGRGIDLNGDGKIDATEGLSPPTPGPLALVGLRDGLRQQVVDLMAFARALKAGLDVDGDGMPDTRGDAISYVGQSLGGIYGTLFLAVDPRLRVGVLNVPGGPIAEVARLSPVFRPALRRVLEGRTPSLLNAEDGFREDLPLRGDPPVVSPAPGALAVQEYLARAEWLARRGDPVAYARYLRASPLLGQEPKRVLIQFAWGDAVVPNPTTSALVRAGQLSDATALLRYDRVAGSVPKELAEPHGFLLRIGAPGAAGTLARAAQEQVARFFLSEGVEVWNPDTGASPPAREPVFEIPAAGLPDRPGFAPTQ
ncbi:MAG TPA: Ig-like domain-containing protein [Methylomirabilota bacterium]|nr:Ig-like domain-containing protein [Methylomirabilota bacterium]